MPKYEPLRTLLRLQRDDELVLTFAEIERVLGSPLPPSARLAQWWSNVTDAEAKHVQRRAWGDAGFDAFLLSGTSKVRFRRVRRAE